jgi:hypothetical protein
MAARRRVKAISPACLQYHRAENSAISSRISWRQCPEMAPSQKSF